ncbi:hypothetical protein MW887_010741 [Aspergillus wentii]|nr:hypothetical protein MW887_010741 [Aspergillus wentii]
MKLSWIYLYAAAAAAACNSAEDRSTWCGDYDITTDYTTTVPETNVTREYWFSIDEVIIAPDGFPRPAIAVNGSVPGPTIYADWGDNVIVHVTNHLEEVKNGTSIHWHGVWQKGSNQHDGVVSITQCPTAPGSSMTYSWRATQYGTSWYHSHIGLQAWEGVYGGIVVNGPATANYDEDKGVVILSDWSHRTVDELFLSAQLNGPPTLDNGLINGTNVYGDGGERFTMDVSEGISYRLRLVNTAIDTHWKFMIDNHELTVIAMDFVPIVPYTAQFVDIAMGQRYDLIIHANQSTSETDSFWIRAIPQAACSENDSTDNIKGIMHYGQNATIPTTTAYAFNETCNDEPITSLIPYLPKNVAPADWSAMTDVTVNRNSDNLFRWYLNSTTLEVSWENPTLLQIYNDENITASSSTGVIDLPNANEWIYLLINTSLPVPHPIHLHGHDFSVLAQGTNPWDGVVNTNNPPRRDTAMLGANGYLLIAFETDNPGAWLMHCHIGWHVAEGFALQFVERKDEMHNLIDYDSLRDNCASWEAYDVVDDIVQEDSGV